VQRFGLDEKSMLEGFEKGNIFGHIVVLVADPLGNADLVPV
jgi:hypothetical protein